MHNFTHLLSSYQSLLQPGCNFNRLNKLIIIWLFPLLERLKLISRRLLLSPLLSRWPSVKSASSTSSATSSTPTQAASLHHFPEPQLTGQSEEPESTTHSRPGGWLAEYGGMRPAAGQLGPGQQCGPGEQVSEPWWPTTEVENSGPDVMLDVLSPLYILHFSFQNWGSGSRCVCVCVLCLFNFNAFWSLVLHALNLVTCLINPLACLMCF